ncbi:MULTISPECIES: AraC family transcriptional regulator [unclassified Pseudoalteromonas]|uniref:AraC family transcriptional regulator n=1 Tax=unclassified Pseudoalteromonas TaxID=194690 RepID=UPI001F15DFAD|nr:MULTISPECIES: AraC family transcriptional regulator [unclassified Pseudoalteromonas]MCF2826587.1 AraC family transcriptional regulator [Pseudoalteromonas sp. OF5H-5]MCF2833322.1 AraC family transcriptional regulator [Pseudoalteromonas sp. DL2-H6]MCF2926063.1 AraC family transcriptional regulator [Pseudoalteromonas sp. DL2-H1]
MEKSKIWKDKSVEGVELLSAQYTKFEFAKHWHDELAIGVIEEGAEGILYGGQKLIVPKHHVVAINPSEVHTGFPGVPSGWRYRMFYFDLAFLQRLFDNMSVHLEPVVNRTIIDDNRLFLGLLQLHQAMEQASFTLTKESLLLMTLEKVFTQYGSVTNPENTAFIDTHSVFRARDYLFDNWQENISLNDLECLTDSTRFQLIKGFNSAFGLTPHQFLLQIKIQKAKLLLAKGMTCVDTALTCGFYDQSHFSRNFKRAYGVSPSNYRC